MAHASTAKLYFKKYKVPPSLHYILEYKEAPD